MHIEAKKGTKHHTDVILADSGKKLEIMKRHQLQFQMYLSECLLELFLQKVSLDMLLT
jgi:hypothetical protein